MKHVVSISLGSSRRNHAVEVEMLGGKFLVERIGTDGDIESAIRTIKKLDGKVDAFGLGGIDLYLWAGNRRYELKDAKRMAEAAKLTPIVDGSGLKNTLERRVIEQLATKGIFKDCHCKVLMVCGLDRFGMAEELSKLGCQMTFGDLIFGLGIPIPIYRIETLTRIAAIIMPVISKLPFEYLYPTGNKQETVESKYEKYYQIANVIAGDFHYIRRYMPDRLDNKIVITNTVTEDDIKLLTQRGVAKLITTTPEFEGRSFGTNVMEALLIAISGSSKAVSSQQYHDLLEELDFQPRIIDLNSKVNTRIERE